MTNSTTQSEHPAFVRARALDEDVRGFFPQTVEQARAWTPTILWRALNSDVIVAAVPRVECAWSAYIAAVPGRDHLLEYAEVAQRGAKLDEAVARVLFPMFNSVPYAR